jgi:hypothetical protein
MRAGPVIPLVVAVVSLTAGCSFIFVQPLQEESYSRGYTPCTTSRAAPVLDTLLTLTNVGSALYVASENNVTNKTPALAPGLGVAALWAISAGYGYVNTGECEAFEENDGRRAYTPPPIGGRPQFYPQPPPSAPAAKKPPERLDAPRFGG